MSRICAILFITLCTLSCLGAIAVTCISFFSCLLNNPYTTNCSDYLGYYKYCCTNCTIFGYCTIYMYSAGAIVAQAILWAGFVVFGALAHCMNRRAMRDGYGDGDGIQMNSPFGGGGGF